MSVAVDTDIYIIGGETGTGVTGTMELYHNTMFVSDEDGVTRVESENRTAVKSDVELASMKTPRTEAEGVFRLMRVQEKTSDNHILCLIAMGIFM